MRPLCSVAVLAALSLCACASGPPDGPPDGPPGRDVAGGPPPGGGPRGGPGGDIAQIDGGPSSLFISPSGEPFRSQPGEPYPVVVWFDQADANHDGRLDRDEFTADAMRFFAVLDRNHDGLIDNAELAYYEHVIAPEIIDNAPRLGALDSAIVKAAYLTLDQGGMGGGMGGMGGGGGGHGGGGGPPPEASGGSAPSPQMKGPRMDGAAPFGLLDEPEPVAASDLSFSGRITSADFRRRAGQRFDRLDKDKQGYLTLASLPKTMAQSMGGDRRRHRRPA